MWRSTFQFPQTPTHPSSRPRWAVSSGSQRTARSSGPLSHSRWVQQHTGLHAKVDHSFQSGVLWVTEHHNHKYRSQVSQLTWINVCEKQHHDPNCCSFILSQGGKEYLMRAHFGLPSVEAEDKEGKPPISVKFEIPYFTTSGIQVRCLPRCSTSFIHQGCLLLLLVLGNW